MRYEPGETKNEDELPRAYARLADVYVNDAFGAAHRAHASIEGVTRHVSETAAGRLHQREAETLEEILRAPPRPFVAIVGGAKVTDKIGVVDRLLESSDAILVGGAMCFPFFRAQGHATGGSLCEEDGVGPARRALEQSEEEGRADLELPVDLVLGDRFVAHARRRELDGVDVPDEGKPLSGVQALR